MGHRTRLRCSLERVYRGRKPSYTRVQYETVQDLLGKQMGIGAISAATGLTRQTIYRIRRDQSFFA
jgi:hypothetical protein